MAEQYILPNATSKILKPLLKNMVCTITTVAHLPVGWTAASRRAYNGLMGLPGGAALVGRANLPPHFYIEIPSGANTDGLYKDSGDFARALSRGAVPTVLKALVAGNVQWTEGRKMESLIQEIAHGNVSISIYHLDGVEVGQVQRDKVHAFPRPR